MVVESINCRLSGQNCPEQLNQFLDQFKGVSIFMIDKKKIKTGLLSTGIGLNPIITLKGKQIDVYLDKNVNLIPLQVFFTSLVPSFNFETSTSSTSSPWQELSNLVATQSSQLMNLNPAGILQKGDLSSNIFLFASQSPNKDRTLRIQRWIEALPEFDLGSPEIYFLNSFIVVSQQSEFIFLVSYQQDPDEILKSWAQIRSVAIAKKLNVLDFRYNHPILR